MPVKDDQAAAWLRRLPRAVGHTQALIESGATIVAATEYQARHIRERGAEAVGLHAAQDGTLSGKLAPVAMDLPAVVALCNQVRREAYRGRKAFDERWARAHALRAMMADRMGRRQPPPPPGAEPGDVLDWLLGELEVRDA